MSAGRLDVAWVERCCANEGGDETLEGWITRAKNCREVVIDQDGSVWVGDHWLDQAECDELMLEIDRGV